ncbi:unknown [Helicoverpa armigera nucleopolyhedrovirus]|uniref:Ac43 n=4 Tax=Alphabaculovirus helarmigerae TaxID=3047947 RepID=Q77K88_9ABAC|nr:hypothetical protein HanGV4gp037 [Helicoverpa armigera nucleopolyhedrovirus G4]NP_203593.1 hypothetical protein [Helicoverpa armigera nucleopolyhedrovirus]AAL56182.1 ORF37 [Helicoverpa zea single nucleopolyhedrovirus]AEN03961.1 hypothetical protein [Helicoverpa armigera NPV strain Australia]AIG63079.1 ORF37 [Helicoverpa SNPV AC53]AIG63216.1 ORF37 [Helicoverpa armigera SNPV]AXR98026.1 hypothetical protein [Helicoverpa assulta nucleopolyhedrovirus]
MFKKSIPRNIYATCFVCDDTIYVYRKCSALKNDAARVAQKFFSSHQGIKKNNTFFCHKCYNDMYMKPMPKHKHSTLLQFY